MAVLHLYYNIFLSVFGHLASILGHFVFDCGRFSSPCGRFVSLFGHFTFTCNRLIDFPTRTAVALHDGSGLAALKSLFSNLSMMLIRQLSLTFWL